MFFSHTSSERERNSCIEDRSSAVHQRNSRWVHLLGTILLLLPLVLTGCDGLSFAPTLQLVELDIGIPQAAQNSPVTGQVPDATKLHIGVSFKTNQSVLSGMDRDKGDSKQHSKLEDTAKQLGVNDETYQKIKGFFDTQGIALKLSKMRTHMNLDAKASTLSKLLQTSFVYREYQGRRFYSPKTPPKLPKFLADSIISVTGLDNYSVKPQTNLVLGGLTPQHATKSSQPERNCNASSRTLPPKQVAHAYGYDQLWNQGLNGQGMTINLVEIDAFDPTDIQNYFSCVNFQGKLQSANVDGQPRSSLGENTLDIQMVAGLARAANINVYQTDGDSNGDIWTQVNDMLQQITDDNTNNNSTGNVVSVSLGAAESEISSSSLRAIDQSLQVLKQAEHMTVFVASGDCGAFTTRQYGDLSVSFPASDPWSTSVGGTILQVDQSGNRANEKAWSDGSNRSTCKNQWGTGGGNSQVFPKPTWQKAQGLQNSNHRQLPDISAAAYSLAIYYNGRWGGASGTSAAAPIWAAGMVLVNQGLIKDTSNFAFSPGVFYATNSSGSGFNDITQGDNLYYKAGQGWDYPTGLGSPNLPRFYQSLDGLMKR